MKEDKSDKILQKDDIIIERNTMILPKQFDFNIKSFKMTIVVEDNEMNPIRLKEQTMISRTFELTIDALSFSLKFKREMINNVLIIKIVSFLKMKSFLFQAEDMLFLVKKLRLEKKRKKLALFKHKMY